MSPRADIAVPCGQCRSPGRRQHLNQAAVGDSRREGRLGRLPSTGHSLPHRAMINLSDSGQTGIGFGWKPVAAVAAGVLVALVAGYEAGQGNFAIAASLAAVIGIIAALSRPHLIVAVGGFLLLVPIATVLSIPGNEIGAALIVAGAWAAKREQTTLPTAVLVIVPIFIGWLLIIQLIHPNGADGWHRMLHLLLLLALATTGASGRIPTRSLAIGIGTAMALSTVLVVASVGPYQSAYEGRASGFFGDPNTFAVTAAVLTPFMFGFLRSAWIRWSLLICAIVVISASLSRTGILALRWLGRHVVHAAYTRLDARLSDGGGDISLVVAAAARLG